MGAQATASRSPALRAKSRILDFRFWILDFGLGIISIEPSLKFAGELRAIGLKSKNQSK